ncbi:MAG: RND transporter [Alphaproteobacteria bacterium]
MDTHSDGWSFTRFLDRLPVGALLALTVLLGLAPFLPEPHLWEKLKMLAAGTLNRPIDIFDLCLHTAPLLLLAVKVGRMTSRKAAPQDGAPPP